MLDAELEKPKGLNNEVIDQMVAHLRADTTDMAASDLRVPVANYVDEAHAAAERALFKRLPLIVAVSGELQAPGSFITRQILGTPIIVVRQDDGTVAAFLNRCTHRGGVVENAASGNKRVFTCEYHGWSFKRDGALQRVPYEEFFEPIDRACNGLHRLQAEERHGFIWVDFSDTEERSVADYLGPEADAQLATFELDKAIVFMDHHFDLDANWKLVIDGAIDITHPPFLHPEGVAKLLHPNASVWKDYGRHGQLYSARRRLAALAKSGEPIKTAWRYFATNLFVYPNTMVIAAPDHVEQWSVWPSLVSASKCHINIRFLVDPAILTDEMKTRLNRSWEILSKAASEDFPMEVTIQTNSVADPRGSYLYGRNEISCQHLHRQLRQDVGDA